VLGSAYIFGKVLVSFVFIVISIFMIFACTQAVLIKNELINLEHRIREDINSIYNLGAAVISVIITSLFARAGTKGSLLLTALSYTGLTRYKTIYEAFISSYTFGKELSSKIITSFKK
jgi:hypothetical protein